MKIDITEFERDLRVWAYDQTAVEPQQDFDLYLAGWARPIFLQFAADKTCPRSDYFLNVLYLVTGDVIQAGKTEESVVELEALVLLGKASPSEHVGQWASATEKLLKSPEDFSFAFWCDQGWRAGT